MQASKASSISPHTGSADAVPSTEETSQQQQQHELSQTTISEISTKLVPYDAAAVTTPSAVPINGAVGVHNTQSSPIVPAAADTSLPSDLLAEPGSSVSSPFTACSAAAQEQGIVSAPDSVTKVPLAANKEVSRPEIIRQMSSASSVTSEEEGMIREDEEEEEGAVVEDDRLPVTVQTLSPRRSLAERFSAVPLPARRWGYTEARQPAMLSSHPTPSSAASSSSRDRVSGNTREPDRSRERDRERVWDRLRDKDWDLDRERKGERDGGRLAAPSSRIPATRSFEELPPSRLPRGGDSYRPASATPRPQMINRTLSDGPLSESDSTRDREFRRLESSSPQTRRDIDVRDEKVDQHDVTSSPAIPSSCSNSVGTRSAPSRSFPLRDEHNVYSVQPSPTSSIRPWGVPQSSNRWNKWSLPRDGEIREANETRREDERVSDCSGDPVTQTSTSRPLTSPSDTSAKDRRLASPPYAPVDLQAQRRSSRSSRSPVTSRSVRSQSTAIAPTNSNPVSPSSSRGGKSLPKSSAFEPPQSDSGWGLKARKNPFTHADSSAVFVTPDPAPAISTSEGPNIISSLDINQKTQTVSLMRTSPQLKALRPDLQVNIETMPNSRESGRVEVDVSPVPRDTRLLKLHSDAVSPSSRSSMQVVVLGGHSPEQPQSNDADSAIQDAFAGKVTTFFDRDVTRETAPVNENRKLETPHTVGEACQAQNPEDAQPIRSEDLNMSVDVKPLSTQLLPSAPSFEAGAQSTAARPILAPYASDVSTMVAPASAALSIPAEARVQASVERTEPNVLADTKPAASQEDAGTMQTAGTQGTGQLQESGSYFPHFEPETSSIHGFGDDPTAAIRSNLFRASEEPATVQADHSTPRASLGLLPAQVSPGLAFDEGSPSKSKRGITPLPSHQSQEELDGAKRSTIRRLLLLKGELSEEQASALTLQNRRLAIQTTFNLLESAIHGPPFSRDVTVNSVGFVEESDKMNQVRLLLTKRLSASNKRLQEKVVRLRSRYRALDTDWKAHCARLDRAAELREATIKAAHQIGTPGGAQQSQQPTQPGVEDNMATSDGHRPNSILGGPSITSSRANRRGTQSAFGFGDAVRSEAEFLEILASLESADMQDPEARAARTATTVPDQIIHPDRNRHSLEDWDDRNGFVANPVALYLDGFDPDHWSEEEKVIFARKYAIWPKQFGKIASALPNKTAAQCVYHYYLTKHHPGHDYKAITARNRSQKRKGKNKPKKAKGSALMADLKRGAEETIGDDDDVGSPMESAPSHSHPSLLDSVDVSLLPLAEEDESFEGQDAAANNDPRKAVNDMATDSNGPPATPTERSGKTKGGKRGRWQSKAKAALALNETASPSVDSSAATPNVDPSVDPELAAAEALGALSGVIKLSPPDVPEQIRGIASKGKKRKTAGEPLPDGGAEGLGPAQRKARSATSSYWSIQERTEFLRSVATNGKDWTGVSSSLGAKSAAQARNFFTRNAQVPEFIEAAQLGEENAHLPPSARERIAADWVRERIGTFADEGSIAKGALIDVRPSEEEAPRRGGMGIMSLLNNDIVDDTKKKPSLQEWFGGDEAHGDGARHAMSSSDDRIFSSSVNATDDDDSTDTEDPYAPSQFPSQSSTLSTSHQNRRSIEPRPLLPDHRSNNTAANGSQAPEAPGRATAAQRPMPLQSVASNNLSLPRLTTASTVSSDLYNSYGDYSRFSRSPAYDIRNQLSPLVPLSSSRTAPSYSRGTTLHERGGQMPIYDRSTAGHMPPPPPLSAGSLPPTHRPSWVPGPSPSSMESQRQHRDLLPNSHSSSTLRVSLGSPPSSILDTEQNLHSHSASPSLPTRTASLEETRYPSESGRPSSASGSLPTHFSRNDPYAIANDEGGAESMRRPISSDGRPAALYGPPLLKQHQQPYYGTYSSSSLRDLPPVHVQASAAAAPPPPPPTLPAAGGTIASRERAGDEASRERGGNTQPSYRWSGSERRA